MVHTRDQLTCCHALFLSISLSVTQTLVLHSGLGNVLVSQQTACLLPQRCPNFRRFLLISPALSSLYHLPHLGHSASPASIPGPAALPPLVPNM